MNNIKDKEDCFTSTLVIRDLASDDMRSYKLIVENVHGIDSLQVNLTIEGKEYRVYNYPLMIDATKILLIILSF